MRKKSNTLNLNVFVWKHEKKTHTHTHANGEKSEKNSWKEKSIKKDICCRYTENVKYFSI